jgi:ribosomal protein S18 acetylase RimI-like enzyme
MTSSAGIRAARPDDLPAIRALAVESGLFAAEEAEQLFTSVDTDETSLWLVAPGAGPGVAAAAYVVGEPVSDRVWNMLFLAVSPEVQGSGLGRALVSATESQLVGTGASALVVETSSGEAYAAARSFYSGLGFEQVGRIPRYYGPGEDKVVLWKQLPG